MSGGSWHLTGSVVVLMVAVTSARLAFNLLNDVLYGIALELIFTATNGGSVSLLGCGPANAHGIWRLVCWAADASNRQDAIVLR